MGVLEVGHETVGAGVQGVDDHFAVHRAGDLDAAVLQVFRDGQHLPVALAHRFGFKHKAREFAAVNGLLPDLALAEQFQTAGVEFALEFGEELQRLR